MHNKTFIQYLHMTAILLALMAMLTACEKPILDETTGEVVPSKANVILRFKQYEWTEQREPFELARKWPSRDGQRRSQHEAFDGAATPVYNLQCCVYNMQCLVYDMQSTSPQDARCLYDLQCPMPRHLRNFATAKP